MRTIGFSDLLKTKALFVALLVMLISGCELNTDKSTSRQSSQNNTGISKKTGVGIIGSQKAVLSATKVSNLAELITVRIEGAVEGSGVIVQKDENTYTVVTAWHVIKDNAPGEEIVAVTNDKKAHVVDGSSLEKIENVDLGLLTFKSDTKYSHALLGQAFDSQSGETLYVSGYPLSSTSVPIRVRRFTKGKVVANTSTFMSNGYQLLYSNQTLPGMSGGGVFDRYGRLIAIHGLAETDIKLTTQTGLAVKTGTNQGIPILQYLEPDTQQIKQDDPDKIDQKLVKIVQLLNIERPYNDGNRGYRFNFNGMEDDVIQLTNEALAIQPNNHNLYNYRGLATKNRPTTYEKKLAKKFQESLVTGDSYSYYKYLTQSHKERVPTPESFHEENEMTALLDFKKAYELKPDFIPARINAAQTYSGLGFYNLAIQEIDKALEFDDENTGLHILRGNINGVIAFGKVREKYGKIDADKMIDKYGEELFLIEMGDFYKLVYRDSCTDFKNAAERGSLISGLYMISSPFEPCARLKYEVDKKYFVDTLKNLDSIIAFYRKSIAPFIDSTTGYIQEGVMRNDDNEKERKAHESFEKYIQATFAKGMLRLIAGEKKEACDLLEYTYGAPGILSFELDANLDNKSVNYRRFDYWTFDNVCNIDFSP